jgi:uncharacterized protein (DUF433 family)
MKRHRFHFIGRGVYTLREAHSLTGVPTRRIRRWTTGYYFNLRAARRFSEPVINTAVPELLGAPAIDFADLIEVRFLNAFREHGVSWNAIRIASQRAREILGTDHPFSHRSFSTDGKTILARLIRDFDDPVLLDLVRDQYEFNRMVSRYLRGEIDFGSADTPQRWYPLGESRRHVVVDPQRALGMPIVSATGIPTQVLAEAVAAEGSEGLVSDLYRVDPLALAEALEFERSRAA